MSFLIESGRTIKTRPPAWEIVDTADDPDLAYRLMVSRAHYMRVLYEPHGGRKLRVRRVTP